MENAKLAILFVTVICQYSQQCDRTLKAIFGVFRCCCFNQRQMQTTYRSDGSKRFYTKTPPHTKRVDVGGLFGPNGNKDRKFIAKRHRQHWVSATDSIPFNSRSLGLIVCWLCVCVCTAYTASNYLTLRYIHSHTRIRRAKTWRSDGWLGVCAITICQIMVIYW